MANQLGIIHPGMLAALPNHYPATCTIQGATTTQSGTGALSQSWANVTGLVSLPCRLAPVNATEVRQATGTFAEATHTIALAGYYSAIVETQRAVVGGVNYDIVGVQHDGNSKSTRLLVRLVR